MNFNAKYKHSGAHVSSVPGMVLHLDMPRGFTFAIKDFKFRLCEVLGDGAFKQVDSNPLFWRFFLTNHLGLSKTQISILFDKEYSNNSVPAFYSLSDALNEYNQSIESKDFMIGLDGLHLKQPEILFSAERINSFIENSNSISLLWDFVAYLDNLFKFRRYQLISIGCESNSSLLIGICLANYVKRNYPNIHIGIGGHHYENFSLLFTLDELLENKDLFRWVDSISLYEEFLDQYYKSILSLLSSGNTKSLSNVVIKSSDNNIAVYEPNRLQNSQPFKLTSRLRKALNRYILDLQINPLLVHYNLPLINNKCYYGKCIFCVQIHKHFETRFYNEIDTINDSLVIVKELHKIGITNFSFIDEALRQRDIEFLVGQIQNLNIKITWNLRMIADVKVNSKLIKSMYSAGCREVLFGLETINEETAKFMGKISDKSAINDIVNMCFNFTQNKINLILSMIYDFPLAKDNEYDELANFAHQIGTYNDRVMFIFNRFTLFGNTKIYKNHSLFGIKEIIEKRTKEDLRNEYDYVEFGLGKSLDERKTLKYSLLKLQIKSSDVQHFFQKDNLRRLYDFYYLSYSSFGFVFEQANSMNLYALLKNELLEKKSY